MNPKPRQQEAEVAIHETLLAAAGATIRPFAYTVASSQSDLDRFSITACIGCAITTTVMDGAGKSAESITSTETLQSFHVLRFRSAKPNFPQRCLICEHTNFQPSMLAT
jgi:hypothetical protein